MNIFDAKDAIRVTRASLEQMFPESIAYIYDQIKKQSQWGSNGLTISESKAIPKNIMPDIERYFRLRGFYVYYRVWPDGDHRIQLKWALSEDA